MRATKIRICSKARRLCAFAREADQIGSIATEAWLYLPYSACAIAKIHDCPGLCLELATPSFRTARRRQAHIRPPKRMPLVGRLQVAKLLRSRLRTAALQSQFAKRMVCGHNYGQAQSWILAPDELSSGQQRKQ
jgi:hypothetical protein